MFIRVRVLMLGAIAALAAALSLTSAAQAAKSTLWVASGATNTGSGSSCSDPGYGNIQAAIEAAAKGDTIDVCPGTYSEQLTITRQLTIAPASGPGTVTVALPASPAESTTSCDAAGAAEGGGTPEDEISICTSGKVTISDITVEAKWPAGTCDDNIYGILVGGGATLAASDVDIDAAGADPINGCQGGTGIQVGMAWTHPSEVGHAKLRDDRISGYQKNGITVDGAGSSAKITEALVIGASAEDLDGVFLVGREPSKEIAQNGIQISNGALGQIMNSTIVGNECGASSCGPNPLSEYQAAGVLFYGAASGSDLVGSHVYFNDMGVYTSSESPTQPSSPEVKIDRDDISNGDEGIVLDQGDTSIEKTVVGGLGNVDIAVLQYEGQSYAPNPKASDDDLTDAKLAAIAVYSDGASGDKPGSFTVSKSEVGSGSAGHVSNQSSNYTVTLLEDKEH